MWEIMLVDFATDAYFCEDSTLAKLRLLANYKQAISPDSKGPAKSGPSGLGFL